MIRVINNANAINNSLISPMLTQQTQQNAAFTPSAAERALAQRVVDAFAGGASGAGAVSLDGKMYDLPHLKAARRVLNLPSP